MPVTVARLEGCWVAATGAAATAAGEGRLITGLVAPYGSTGYTSAGALTITPGAIRLPADLSRVKLLVGHDRDIPIGYAVTADDTPAGLVLQFRIAPTPAGDAALLEAAHKTRDAFSVELDQIALDGDTITDAELTAVALLAVPAFANARVATVAAQRQETPAMSTPDAPITTRTDRLDQPDDTTDLELDTALDNDDDDDGDAELDAPPPAVQAARRPAGLPAGTRRRSGMSFGRAMDTLRRTVADRGPAALVAALTDITPANDAGAGFLQPQWLGELWSPIAETRRYANAVTRKPLTSGLKVYGWRWAARPTVGVYAGNKTPIPSSTASTEPAEAPVVRYAGGWDLDRIYVDLGESGFLESFFDAAARDLAAKQDAGLGDVLETSATVSVLEPADVWSAIDAVSQELQAVGAQMTFAAIAPDLWSAYVSTPAAEVPWWVQSGSAPGLSDSTGTAAGLSFFLDPNLTAGTVLGGDRRAVSFYETGTIRVQAVNIPNGGVDLAVFAYQATLVNDPSGLVKATVAPVIP